MTDTWTTIERYESADSDVYYWRPTENSNSQDYITLFSAPTELWLEYNTIQARVYAIRKEFEEYVKTEKLLNPAA